MTDDIYNEDEDLAMWEQERWFRALTYLSSDPDDYYGSTYAAKTIVADRREVCLIQWSMGAALSVGMPGDQSPSWYDDQWLYQRRDWAFEAFEKWHGEGERAKKKSPSGGSVNPIPA